MKNALMCCLTLAVGAAGCGGTGMTKKAEAAAERAAAGDEVARGRYLVKIMVCNDCHTPFTMGPNGPEPDMSRQLSGHPEQVGPLKATAAAREPWIWSSTGTNTAFAGPWGISYTANLTPDTNTGLGIWTEEMFMKAIRSGRHMGTSRPILPPMPWPMYRNASDEDLKAIYAYLRSIPAVTNRVPEPVINDAGSSASTD